MHICGHGWREFSRGYLLAGRPWEKQFYSALHLRLLGFPVLGALGELFDIRARSCPGSDLARELVTSTLSRVLPLEKNPTTGQR